MASSLDLTHFEKLIPEAAARDSQRALSDFVHLTKKLVSLAMPKVYHRYTPVSRAIYMEPPETGAERDSPGYGDTPAASSTLKRFWASS